MKVNKLGYEEKYGAELENYMKKIKFKLDVKEKRKVQRNVTRYMKRFPSELK